VVLYLGLKPLELSVETVSEGVHLFLFVVDINQISPSIYLKLRVQLVNLQLLDAL
jgi:hypothetical protein